MNMNILKVVGTVAAVAVAGYAAMVVGEIIVKEKKKQDEQTNTASMRCVLTVRLMQLKRAMLEGLSEKMTAEELDTVTKASAVERNASATWQQLTCAAKAINNLMVKYKVSDK